MISDTYTVILSNILLFGMFAGYYLLLSYFTSKSERSSTHRYLSLFLYWLIFVGSLLLFASGLFLHLMVYILQSAPISEIQSRLVGLPLSGAAYAHHGHQIALLIWLCGLFGMSFYIRPFRRFLARFLPIDPQNKIHTITLAFSMLIPFQLLLTAVIGLDTLSEGTQTTSLGNTLASIWSQDIMLALLAMIGVGWFTTRNSKETLKRLGLKRISISQIILAIGVALLFVLAGQLLELLTLRFQVGTDPSVESYTDKLIGPLFTSWVGILTLGLAAAIGEETIFRGALVPRLGIILTSLLFACVHSNYGFTASTLLVFLLGLALGWLRMRFSTTFTMIVHATYNMTLGILVYYQI